MAGAPQTQHWFVIDLVQNVFEGPLTVEEMKRHLKAGKLRWSDIAICPALSFSWIRLYEVKGLAELYPPMPPPEVLKHFRNVGFKQQTHVRLPVNEAVISKEEPMPVTRSPAPQTASNVKKTTQAPIQKSSTSIPAEWHLLIDDNEGGPFTLREIETAFGAGRKPERAYVWRAPMKRWKPIGQVPEFKHLNSGSYGADFADEEAVDEDKLEIESNYNMRRSFRKSFVASVLRISDTGIRQMIGVCGDITLEGMNLLQDTLRVQYPVGSQHTLEIRPIKHTKVPPFRVTAEVRWMDPDSYSIGFQFVDLDEVQRKFLQRYLASVT